MTDTDAEELLAQLVAAVESLDISSEKIETYCRANTGHEVTCGVCGDWYAFAETDIPNTDVLDYDEWDTRFDDEYHQQHTDQERVCYQCVYDFLQTGTWGDDP